MNIEVIRKYKKEGYTIGQMYIDGEPFCQTLEDKDRGLSKGMAAAKLKALKVYGETAIPTGTYQVGVVYWAKFKNYYPIIYRVPAFTGIMIHGGASAKDTLGCILLGENKIKGGLVNSAKYVRELTNRIRAELQHGNLVKITIK